MQIDCSMKTDWDEDKANHQPYKEKKKRNFQIKPHNLTINPAEDTRIIYIEHYLIIIKEVIQKWKKHFESQFS